jgi:hypothetical protein
LVSCLSGTNPFPALSFEDSLSLSASMASITKTFPPSCGCMDRGLFEEVKCRLTAARRELPEGYLTFVRKITRELFPKGVKKASLDRRAELVVPPLTSTTSHSR